jgi:hypothetical protein
MSGDAENKIEVSPEEIRLDAHAVIQNGTMIVSMLKPTSIGHWCNRGQGSRRNFMTKSSTTPAIKKRKATERNTGMCWTETRIAAQVLPHRNDSRRNPPRCLRECNAASKSCSQSLQLLNVQRKRAGC